MSTNKSFGIVFFIVFIIIALYPLLNQENLRIWSLIISFLFLILGLLNSKILTPFNKLWFKFGIILGKIFSPLIISFKMDFIKEFWKFLKVRKKYWLFPIIIVLAIFGGLIVLTQGSAVAPFIYTIF